MKQPIETLHRVLRPAGGGVYVVTTGLSAQQALQRKVYGADSNDDIENAWHRSLNALGDARVAVLGVPCDAGAGFVRGSNQAPSAIRAHLFQQDTHPIWDSDVIDLGDVFTIPHLLSDDMLSPIQLDACRRALYGADEDRDRLPVSPLSITENVLRTVYRENPNIRPVVIGGDHSVAWPAFLAAHRHWEVDQGRRLGLLHFDAHTDLLSERLGVRYCFATWAYHANELLGRDGRLVQVGIRVSGRDKAHWEQSLNVRQYWADEAMKRGAKELSDAIGDHFESLGVDALYVSNDIDGTDPQWAAATGTPEDDGLDPDLVSELTQNLATRFPLVGGDLVEVAPPLFNDKPGQPERTLHTAGRYLSDLIQTYP